MQKCDYKKCGFEDDRCGGTVSCGTCPDGQQCLFDGLTCVGPSPCVPDRTTCDRERFGFFAAFKPAPAFKPALLALLPLRCRLPPHHHAPLALLTAPLKFHNKQCTSNKKTAAMKCGTQDNGCGQEILCGECNTDQGYYCQINEADMASECQLVVPPPTQCAENCTDQVGAWSRGEAAGRKGGSTERAI